MNLFFSLVVAGCVLICSAGCTTNKLTANQIAEAQLALSRGEITKAQYLQMKQQAEQAEAMRRAVLLAD
jgi:hypothetical protein